MSAESKTSGSAIASLVLGIAGFLCGLGPLAAIPAVICGHVARGKVKQAAGALEGGGMALAGLILGYVNIGLCIALTPIIVGVTLPAVAKARDAARAAACTMNMSQIAMAKEQAAAEGNLQPGAQIPEDALKRHLGKGIGELQCPRGGRYSVNAVGQDPSCSVHGPMSQAVERSVRGAARRGGRSGGGERAP